jgi:iron complex transport system permease protein
MISNNSNIIWYTGLIILSLCIFCISIFIGSYDFHSGFIQSLFHGNVIDNIYTTDYNVLLQLRIPRVLNAFIIGGALALAGAAMQGLFRNSLADPSLIGVSSGASTFVAIGIVLGLNQIFISPVLNFYSLNILAFIGALIVTLIALLIAGGKLTVSLETLLLSGIALNAICGSITGLMIYLSEDDQLKDISFWMLGSVSGASKNTTISLILFTIIPSIVLIYKGKVLNILSLGEEEAFYSGINVWREKIIIIVMCTLIVASCVAVSGVIGFAGLVVPHLVRIVKGNNYKILLPSSILLGGVILTLSDTAARTIVAPAELPIGILTSIIGGPFFIYLIIRNKKRKTIL